MLYIILYTAAEIKRTAKFMQDQCQQPALKLYHAAVDGLRSLVCANLVGIYACARLLM